MDDRSSSYFIELTGNAGLTGVVIYHKEQEQVATPVPYPWSIMMHGNNPAVTDVEILNSWNGINATLAGDIILQEYKGNQ